MIKRTKTLEGYIKTMPYVGGLTFLGGLVFAIGVLDTKFAEDWRKYYFHFKALGAILGYLWVSRGHPGGLVTFNLDKAKYSEDEKAFNNLIIKYRSNILIALVPIIYLVADFIKSRNFDQTKPGTIDGYLTSIIIGAFVSLTLCLGVKYLSAWWNIKRNWKKEFKN